MPKDGWSRWIELQPILKQVNGGHFFNIKECSHCSCGVILSLCCGISEPHFHRSLHMDRARSTWTHESTPWSVAVARSGWSYMKVNSYKALASKTTVHILTRNYSVNDSISSQIWMLKFKDCVQQGTVWRLISFSFEEVSPIDFTDLAASILLAQKRQPPLHHYTLHVGSFMRKILEMWPYREGCPWAVFPVIFSPPPPWSQLSHNTQSGNFSEGRRPFLDLSTTNILNKALLWSFTLFC